jgi:hypothetical protein
LSLEGGRRIEGEGEKREKIKEEEGGKGGKREGRGRDIHRIPRRK